MEFIQHLETWTKTDVNQGKFMLAIAILIVLPVCLLLFKTHHTFQKGMLIPLGVLFLLNMGYGSYLLISKPKYVEQTKKRFQLDPQKTIENEGAKVKADDKSYTITKDLWAGLFVLSVVFFVCTKEYFQGLSLGFSLMFAGMFLIDFFLHRNLKFYLQSFIS